MLTLVKSSCYEAYHTICLICLLYLHVCSQCLCSGIFQIQHHLSNITFRFSTHTSETLTWVSRGFLQAEALVTPILFAVEGLLFFKCYKIMENRRRNVIFAQNSGQRHLGKSTSNPFSRWILKKRCTVKCDERKYCARQKIAPNSRHLLQHSQIETAHVVI